MKFLHFAILMMFVLPVMSQERIFEITSPNGEVTHKAVGNFTIIDSDGITWTLYDELDNGNTIMIDIFQAT
ncbi:MAG TPA: hypothetical protein PLI65_02165 [Bacteroidales bacterium]|nr:hypothetical protein [Bacteroidales bacterium]HPR57000.1 hypothetical protein [Bacteroidales bacterium]HRW96682.1 hypothetical protein [Bacteroidales bacterium]